MTYFATSLLRLTHAPPDRVYVAAQVAEHCLIVVRKLGLSMNPGRSKQYHRNDTYPPEQIGVPFATAGHVLPATPQLLKIRCQMQ